MSVRLTADDAELWASVKLGEGLRLRAYPDPLTHGAPYTVGYGHTGPEVGPSTTFTIAQAEAHLASDLADAMSILDIREPWWRTMTLDRQRVLAEMAFNLGWGHLITFHRFLVDLQERRWADAAAEMLDSAWALQVGDRANRLSDRMRAG